MGFLVFLVSFKVGLSSKTQWVFFECVPRCLNPGLAVM